MRYQLVTSPAKTCFALIKKLHSLVSERVQEKCGVDEKEMDNGLALK